MTSVIDTFFKSIIVLGWALGVALLSPTRVQSQTIAEAVRLGLDNSPGLQAEKMRLNGISEQQVQARNLMRPQVQLEAATSLRQSMFRQRGPYRNTTTEPGSVSVTASQPLFLGGRYEAAAREADLRVAQSVARIRSRELTTIRQVIEAYANVRRDSQTADIRALGVRTLTTQLTGARERRNEGLVGLTEVSQVETRLAIAQSSASVARARLQSSWATLERLIGTRPTGLTEDEIVPVGLPQTLPEAIDLAQLMSHDLKVSRFNEDIAQAIARGAQAESAPRVNLTATVSGTADNVGNGSRSYDAQIGARLVVPFWNGGQPQSQTRAALAEANASRIEASGFERVLAEQVTQAWAALESARNASDIAKELLRAAQIARTGAELEFDIGLRSIIEVLNQEQELQDARVNLVNSRSNLMVAYATIFTLIGLDPTGVISGETEFDPTRTDAPFSQRKAGQPSKWERPLITVFEGLSETDRAIRPVVANLRRAVFGPEQ